MTTLIRLAAILSIIIVGNIDAQNLIPISTYYVGPNSVRSIFVQGHYVYLGESGGMEIVDVADPYNPENISFYESNSVNIVKGFGDFVYVLYEFDFFVVDISNPTNPVRRGNFDLDYVPGRSFTVYSTYAYITNDWGNIDIVDISNPDSLIPAGWMQAEDDAGDVVCQDFILYVAITSSGLHSYNISDPQNPIYLGELRGSCNRVIVNGNYAYYLSGSGLYALKIADITNPARPHLAGTYVLPGRAGYIAKFEDYALVSLDTSGIEIINIGEPTNPYFAAHYDIQGHADDIMVEGDYIYLNDRSNLRIFRFDPTDIEENKVNLPEKSGLSQNYPNPFNSQTIIQFILPMQSRVSIEIYDIMGRRIETVENSVKSAGEHLVIWSAGSEPSGVYFYRLVAGNITKTKRMILLK